jgi:hypothetical protein
MLVRLSQSGLRLLFLPFPSWRWSPFFWICVCAIHRLKQFLQNVIRCSRNVVWIERRRWPHLEAFRPTSRIEFVLFSRSDPRFPYICRRSALFWRPSSKRSWCRNPSMSHCRRPLEIIFLSSPWRKGGTFSSVTRSSYWAER